MYRTKPNRSRTGRLVVHAVASAAWTLSLGFGLPVWASVSATPDEIPLDIRLREERLFEEPLVATGPSSLQEQQALWEAVRQYRESGDAESFEPLQAFLSQYPNSAWGLALHTNLGLTYYRLGYFSRAMDAWEAAWRETRGQTLPETKRLADRALGELIRMHARLGHANRVSALLEETKNRSLQGSATEAVAGAREGLWMMQNDPGVAYLCGPMALKNILEFQGADKHRIATLEAVRSGSNGVTLDMVGQLAKRVKLPYTVARRSPGTPIPLPAVVHWKVNHYAAIVGEDGERYHLKDPTFGRDLWISKSALEAETSNYFVIPAQAAKQPGWHTVAQAEAKKIFGMGATTAVDDTRLTPDDVKACECKSEEPSPGPEAGAAGGAAQADGASLGMPTYNVHAMLVSLNLVDTPISYQPPKGPAIQFTLTYNQRDAQQPANFTYFNFGPKWTSNWLSYVQDDPTSPGSNVLRYVAGGGAVPYAGYNSATGAFSPGRSDGSVLVRVAAGRYELRMNDGSRQVYGQPDGATFAPRRVFLSQIIDPQGNSVSLTYDSKMRLSTVTDARGKASVLEYGNTANPLLVTKITDPFGRTAQMGYDASGRLSDITDAIGMKSSFGYDTGTFINTMTTPYGTTKFAYGESGVQRWINITNPLGQTERIEYAHQAPGIPYSEASTPSGMTVFNAYINYRNTFYWNADAYAKSAGDYTKARIFHWLHSRENTNTTAGVLESMVVPGESRIWYLYPDQSSPSITGSFEQPTAVGRLRDDGSTELFQYTYDAKGRMTSRTAGDAVGHRITYDYTTDYGNAPSYVHDQLPGVPIAGYSYNAQYRPVIYADAQGQNTRYTYNASGQKLTETDPNGFTAKWEYDADGLLQRVINAAGNTETSFTYDAVGRVASRTDALGNATKYQYDALNRLTQTEYADGSKQLQTWDRLDLSSVTDPLGRVTRYAYDGARNLVTTTDALGRSTQYSYYPNGKLKSMTVPSGTVTEFTYTPAGRKARQTVTTAAGAVALTTYDYTGTGLLARMTQPDGSYITRSYDDWRRLSATADAMGNRVQTTLDGRGNPMVEQTFNASGVLLHQSSRLFDRMHRPIQIFEGVPYSYELVSPN